jgi:glycosyltransferase involved in cell wall biosynthesis
MSQITKLPCGKIVLCQAYDHILETLQPGENWNQLGFFKCLTTSETQKEYLENVMRNVSYDILPPYISNDFVEQKLPPKPIIAIHSREQRDGINLIKNFYVKFPQYRWVTFKDMRGLSEKEFANVFKDCFLSVWIDETSGYGTFPLESMKCGVPVLGLTPNLVPQWMNSENGLWVNNKIQMVDFVADFLQNWLEDNVKDSLYEEMTKTVENLPTKKYFESVSVSLFETYINTRMISFEEQLNKLISVE